MKAKGAIILVELNDNKVYQVDVSSDEIMYYLNIISMKEKDYKLPILDKPITGMRLTPVLNEEIRKDSVKNCKLSIEPMNCGDRLNNDCRGCSYYNE